MSEPLRIVPDDFRAREFHASKERPCPVCEKTGWCLRGDGWALCQRIESPTRWKDAGWFHRLGETPDAPRRPFPLKTRSLGSTLPVKPITADAAPLPDIAAYEAALASPEAASVREWLEARGISPDTVAGFRLGAFNRTGEWWLAIPQYKAGELANVKYRAVATKDFQRVKGRPSILFNVDVLKGAALADGCVVIVEGELDVLALAEMGIENVVGLTNGAGKLESDWYDALTEFHEAGNLVIMLCDNDLGREDGKNPGQDGAREIIRRLGIENALNCILPDEIKDANDYLKAALAAGKTTADAGAQLRAHIADTAELLSLQNAMPLRDAIEIVFQNNGALLPVNAAEVIDLPDPILNSLFHNTMHTRGFIPYGTLTAFLAPPKVGKTTFAQQICLHNAIKGIPIFDYCLEMTPHEKGLLYLQQFVGHALPFNAAELDRVRNGLCAVPITLGYNQTGTKPETVLGTMSAVVGRTGARLIVLDNLQYMFRGKDEYSRISEFTITLKDAAAALGVVLIVIVQPNISHMRGHNKMLDYTGVQTVTNIAADVDFFCILHRAVQAETESGESVFADEGKFKLITRLSRGGIRDIVFNPISRTFRSVAFAYQGGEPNPPEAPDYYQN